MRFRVYKDYDVEPTAVEEVAEQMLEWMDAKGWRPVWSCEEKPELKDGDGDELSYRQMAQMFVAEFGGGS